MDHLNHLTRTWGTDDNTWSKNNQLVHEAAEDLLYRNELKHLQKYASESRITSTTTVGSLKNAAIISAEESVERVVEKPRVPVQAKIQHEMALVAEETGLLEETPNEWLSSSVQQCDDQFATCSVSMTYFCGSTNIIGLS